MNDHTLDEVREVKAELVKRLKGHANLAGVGIGLHNGKLVIRVNWRVLPSESERLEKLGDVEITHHEVGSVRPQSED
jgi:hypothetical protein